MEKASKSDVAEGSSPISYQQMIEVADCEHYISVVERRGASVAHAMNKDFYRFSLKQLAVLLFVVCILLVFFARYMRSAHEDNAYSAAVEKHRIAQNDLKAAIAGDNLALARDAIERGARPNAGFFGTQGELWKDCIDTCQPELVELLLECGADPRQSAPADVVGNGPLLFAVASSHQTLAVRRQMLDALLKHGVDINTISSNHRTVMDIAVERNEVALCDLLREYGVPYGPREMVVFDRLAELKEAVANNPEIVKERVAPIYAGEDPSLLGLALKQGHSEIAHFLIDSGAPFDTLEELGQTLMHMAARGGKPDMIKLLAERGLDVNARDNWKDTPLTDSITRTNVETVMALIEVGANVNAKGVVGRTALYALLLDVRSDYYEIIQLLIAAGADPTIADDKGVSPLDLIRNYPPELKSFLKKLLADAAKAD